jgi:FPC/CPF motif-containing protein YcgG
MITIANPFDDAVATAHSNYCLFDGRRLVRANDATPPSDLTAFVHDGIRALTLNERFTCVGAKSAIRQGAYRFALYPELGSADSCAGLARDLYEFAAESPELDSEFTTFIASFAAPSAIDERAFEALLWRTLQQLHDLDVRHHRWDTRVSDDAADPQFSFSFARTAFFIVGLHAGASRVTRRFAWPTLVFNPHEQFDRLRTNGRFARFQEVIRGADRALQGDVNPMVADFGERSEAAQYSGRKVDAGWQCPFHRRPGEPPPH